MEPMKTTTSREVVVEGSNHVKQSEINALFRHYVLNLPEDGTMEIIRDGETKTITRAELVETYINGYIATVWEPSVADADEEASLP
jgi:hypothetical protein